MKFLIPIFLLGFISANAQYYQDDEKQQSTVQSGTTEVFYKIKSPIEFFDLKCKSPKYASFGNGISDLRAAVEKSIEEVVNSEEYAPNGPFTFIFKIGKDGKLSDVELYPKVQNSKYLEEDISDVIKKNLPRFQPAKCAGNSVASTFRIRVNFSSESVDF